MRGKLLLGAVSLMVIFGSLTGCNAVDEVKDMVSPSPSAPAANVTQKPTPSAPAASGVMDDSATETPAASPSPAATAQAE